MSRRLALFLWSFANDYQSLLRKDAVESARRRGVTIEVFDAENNADRQASQISEVLRKPPEQRPAAIMASPVRESSLLALAHRAARAGMGWVLLNRTSRYLRDLRREFPRLAVFCANVDQDLVGRIQARQVRALLPSGGELLCIQGPPTTSSARARLAGLQDELRAEPYELTTFSADWTTEDGARATRDWLSLFRNRDLGRCLIAAQNDDMAVGAWQVLSQRARLEDPGLAPQIPILGVDGSADLGQRLVIERKLAATVIVPSTAGRAIEEVVRVMAGGLPRADDVLLGVSSYPEIAALR